MNDQAEAEKNWNKTKGKLKQQFSILTDNDVQPAEGKTDGMMDRLQLKLGKTKEEIHSLILGTENKENS
ncbi:MAG: CsbD family protein [Bacteroidetes bacterium]|jgi:uncharacterized protein YjbJ (UPF0337 family)|nr:CsbD family protein [Bacteroidota bacterium]